MRKGFNITEMIVVITIFGILAAVIFTNAAEGRKRANDTRRMNDLKQVQAALEAYKLANGKYPVTAPVDDDTFWQASCTGASLTSFAVVCNGATWAKDLNIGITADLLDPRNTAGLEYTYLYGSDSFNYKLMAWKMQSKQGITQAQNDSGASASTCTCAYTDGSGACAASAEERNSGEDANYELFTKGARCW